MYEVGGLKRRLRDEGRELRWNFGYKELRKYGATEGHFVWNYGFTELGIYGMPQGGGVTE